jgi:UDP-GlcNAc:undecaprenyl-phosphate GlcNAc-1-phosphate transferase
MLFYLLIFLVAFVSTLLLTPVVRILALKIGAVDNPNDRKVHKKPTPRLGGLAIYFGFLLAIFAGLGASNLLNLGLKINHTAIFGIIISGTILLLLGFLDDLRGVRPSVKFLVQIAAASLAIYFGIEIGFLKNPFNGFIFLGAASIPLTIFWLVGITNAVNLIDGLDGLASGITAIASITLFFVALKTNQPVAAIILLALAGAAAGFLKFNFNPATVFLGDSGSLFMGFVLASASVIGVLKSTLVIALLIPVLILAVPIYDTASAIIRRIRAKVYIFEADDAHIHHKLLEAGLSHREAVMAIYFVCLLLSAGALIVTFMNLVESLILLSIILAVALVGAYKIRESINLRATEEKG